MVLGDVRRLRAIERRDVGAGERGERGIVGAEHRRGQVVDAGCLLARHDLVAALADLREPLLEVLGARLLLVARASCSAIISGALLGRAEREQHVAGAGVEEADSRADADREAPVARRVHLGDHGDAGAVVDRQMIGLHRADRERAHQRRRLRDEPADRPVEMREPEQLESQLIAVAGVARRRSRAAPAARACDSARSDVRPSALAISAWLSLPPRRASNSRMSRPLSSAGARYRSSIVGVGHCVADASAFVRATVRRRDELPARVVDSAEPL